jgi:heme/copper-type cytochrome/quinol oxidase subunit 2
MASVGLLYVGAVLFLSGAMLLGWVGAISAFLLLTGQWERLATTTAVVLAIFGIVVFAGLYLAMRPRRTAPSRPRVPERSPTPSPTG